MRVPLAHSSSCWGPSEPSVTGSARCLCGGLLLVTAPDPLSAPTFTTSDGYDTGNRLRFQLELEFVQCLANPNYLNFLAQRGYFKDKAFVNYLKYLLYWKEPEYAKYLKYPQCLHMLELLQYEHFRKELVNAQCAKFIDEQQILHWQHYSRKRMRLQQALAEQQQQNNTSVK
ncbi:mediator of RNA polymerase II transcription subunit 31 isoform X1 [Strix aluco]|uniref:mediator of RNA polymerase II transcription subunit 31 isoform X1 n=1 Tax=Strix aluco TaxID=111821 RepID=UPI003DA42709